MASTDLTVVEAGSYLALNHEPSELREIIADNLDGEEMTERDLVRIKVPTGGAVTWEMRTLGGLEAVREVTGIIVHKTRTRAWWPIPKDESKEDHPPSCSSPDARLGYGKQWATKDDIDPDGDPRSVVCKTCPHAQFGSGKNGGQACQEKAQWFLLMQGSFLPIVVTLPAMSLEPAKKYVSLLSSSGLPYWSVVTRLHIEKTTKGGNDFGVVIPELVGNLSPEEAAKVRDYAGLMRGLFTQAAVADATVADDPVSETSFPPDEDLV